MPGSRRNINLYDALQDMLDHWKPDCAFSGVSRADFERWQRVFRRHYRRCTGAMPERVPLRLETLETKDCGDHVRTKIVFDSSPWVSVPAFLLEPKGLRKGEKRPGILASHGHGRGKADIVGVTREEGDKDRIATVDRLNYEYGLEAVRRGYVVIAPDWCPFGERRPPDAFIRVPSRDPCNITNLAWQYFGRPLIAQSIWDGRRAVDVLAAHPHVDAKRMGVLGLSQGGTMTTHMLINEPRLRVGVVSGYLSTVRGDALRDRGNGNTCGAQHVPGLLLHGDIPDMLGLACPKPILVEMGRAEKCFHFPDMERAYRRLQRIYRAAGVADRLAADIHPHGHRWNGVKAWPWLAKWLAFPAGA